MEEHFLAVHPAYCGLARGIIINWKSESINRMATAKLISMNDADDASVRRDGNCNCNGNCTSNCGWAAVS